MKFRESWKRLGAVDILESKLEAAKKFGATHTINAAKEKRYPFQQINDAFHDLAVGRNLMGISLWQ
jgi:Zn-dependent alcohol dehydrogenase